MSIGGQNLGPGLGEHPPTDWLVCLVQFECSGRMSCTLDEQFEDSSSSLIKRPHFPEAKMFPDGLRGKCTS